MENTNCTLEWNGQLEIDTHGFLVLDDIANFFKFEMSKAVNKNIWNAVAKICLTNLIIYSNTAFSSDITCKQINQTWCQKDLYIKHTKNVSL